MLSLSLVQEPREPTFANIPLNGSTGTVRAHSSRMVMSASGMKAGRLVRIEPSRSGETPPAQSVHPTSGLQSRAWWWEGGGKEV